MKTISLCALALACPAVAQPLMIDDFTQGEFDISTRANGSADQLDADNALGGARRLTWTILDNPQNSRFDLQVALAGFPGLGISMGTGNATQTGLTYGGSGADANFLPLALNAADFSLNAIHLNFESVDLETRVAIELLDYDGGAIAGRASVSRLVPANSGHLLAIDFSDFSLLGGFDFSEIDAVQVIFNSTGLPNRDLFLRDVAFVPTPGAAALLGLGIAAATRRRR